MSAALEKLEVDLLKEITVGVTVYLPVGALNHGEMCELMFGSYLLPAETFRAICGQPEDALVQLHGTKANAKFKLIAAPMTASQAVQSFLENAALEQFVEPKLLDTTVKTFKEGLEHDALFLDMSFTNSEATRASLPLFLR